METAGTPCAAPHGACAEDAAPEFITDTPDASKGDSE